MSESTIRNFLMTAQLADAESKEALADLSVDIGTALQKAEKEQGWLSDPVTRLVDSSTISVEFTISAHSWAEASSKGQNALLSALDAAGIATSDVDHDFDRKSARPGVRHLEKAGTRLILA